MDYLRNLIVMIETLKLYIKAELLIGYILL
jgi:hypothetical protein